MHLRMNDIACQSAFLSPNPRRSNRMMIFSTGGEHSKREFSMESTINFCSASMFCSWV